MNPTIIAPIQGANVDDRECFRTREGLSLYLCHPLGSICSRSSRSGSEIFLGLASFSGLKLDWSKIEAFVV